VLAIRCRRPTFYGNDKNRSSKRGITPQIMRKKSAPKVLRLRGQPSPRVTVGGGLVPSSAIAPHGYAFPCCAKGRAPPSSPVERGPLIDIIKFFTGTNVPVASRSCRGIHTRQGR